MLQLKKGYPEYSEDQSHEQIFIEHESHDVQYILYNAKWRTIGVEGVESAN